MRTTERLQLINKIGRELQRRFGYAEIDAFLAEFGISPPPAHSVKANSKWVYSKVALTTASTDRILKIAQELGIDSSSPPRARLISPEIWHNANQFRLFISHLPEDTDKATHLAVCLADYAINSFVAHEDIQSTPEREREIERALHVMDAFISIHTKGFSHNIWTQQEIGFAVCRGVKMISLNMGEDPTGLISGHQALDAGRQRTDEIAKKVVAALSKDERTAPKLAEAKRLNRPKDPEEEP